MVHSRMVSDLLILAFINGLIGHADRVVVIEFSLSLGFNDIFWFEMSIIKIVNYVSFLLLE